MARLANKCVYKLGDIDKKLPISVKLQRCIALDIPVLIKVPDGFNVWAIDVQLHKLTIDDIIQSEKHPADRGRLARYFYGDDASTSIQPVITKPNSLYASTTVADVEYIQLPTVDIEKLKTSESIGISEFKGVFLFDKELNQLTLQSSVPVKTYNFNPLKKYKKTIFDINEYTGINLTFVLCDKKTPAINEFNFPLNDVVNHPAFAKECYLEEKNIPKLIFNESEYKQSIYHLEPEYHISLAFLAMSKAAFNFNVKGTSKSIDGDYLCKVHGFSLSWGKCGAYLVNTFNRTENKFSFATLKELFQTHWITEYSKDVLALDKTLKDKDSAGNSKLSKTAKKVKSDKYKASLAKVIKARASKVTDELVGVYGVPSGYACYVELIIRPDKLKNEKTLKANKIKGLS
ncbi:hypothetical protein [Thalassotalea castellviae]|uniref:Uncharacterized protein n=1 Tax=Thalassotalea castellviae TaxID=3075612 RepID=A0ABU2ZX92_9GAMM|nr:hypothetical protein [Thalassotalea sp. W431]MDT0602545.1 hypothetical protein [Thalassotalea sp. W431]